MNRQQTTHRIVLTAIPTHHGAALRQLLYCRPSYRLLDGCLRRPRPSCLAFMKAFISVSNRRQLPVPSVCDDKYRSILGVKFQVSMSFTSHSLAVENFRRKGRSLELMLRWLSAGNVIMSPLIECLRDRDSDRRHFVGKSLLTHHVGL